VRFANLIQNLYCIFLETNKDNPKLKID